MTTVSIIIPSYNRAEVLPRALDSVMAQKHLPAQVQTEIIAVDDGSTDNTASLLSQHYQNVTVIQQANGGVSAARNSAIGIANGQWLAFLDSDDEWLPNKLARQLALLEQHPDHKLIHSDEIWIRNGTRVNPMNKHRKTGGHIFQQCLPVCDITLRCHDPSRPIR